MSTVRYAADQIPAPTAKRIKELENLAARPDSEIDYSDLPPLTDAFWEKAVRGRFYKAVKKPTSVRIDMDVLEWLKNQGKGYQTRINTILRQAMLHAMQQEQENSKSI